jgi:hypothetical protein
VAYDQFSVLSVLTQSLQLIGDRDTWPYIWGNAQYSSQRAYKHLLGTQALWLDLENFLPNEA